MPLPPFPPVGKKPVLVRLNDLCQSFKYEKIDDRLLTNMRHAVIHLLQHAQLEGEIPFEFNIMDVTLVEGRDPNELILSLDSRLETFLMTGKVEPKPPSYEEILRRIEEAKDD